MNSYLLAIIGTWLLSDAIYSWVLYTNSQSWRGKRQDFIHDNWVRLLRALLAIGILVIGWWLND